MDSLLYTVGYDGGLTLDLLQALLEEFDATLVDCRTKPNSRNWQFRHQTLASRFGRQYEQHGHHLGGFGNTNASGVQFIQKANAAGRTLLLICKEHAPGDCHRHRDICAPHFPDALHIMEDEIFTAAELQRAIVEDTEYECEEFTWPVPGLEA